MLISHSLLKQIKPVESWISEVGKYGNNSNFGPEYIIQVTDKITFQLEHMLDFTLHAST
ncbi:MAG: hypothetical protein IPG89_20800 [Bacteroidetes bacterium]|nr:hypothetical protein [Bacteroidota bacterium]